METVVEIEGCNGEWFTIAGPNGGAEGVYLDIDVQGLYDPPVKVVYEDVGNYPGSRYLAHRPMRRDITFSALILDDRKKGTSWMSRDSEWRKAWSFKRDTKIHVTTEQSGLRTLKTRLGESPEISLYHDPDLGRCNNADMTLVAGDPWWWEESQKFEMKTRSDTRFKPELLLQTPWDQLPRETLKFKVGVANPTDIEIFPVWSLPASDDAIPNMPWPFPENTPIPWEKAPYAQYLLPDYSFENPDQRYRAVRTPALIKGEDCIVNTDPREETYSADNGAPVWERSNGVRFRNHIPPYTGSVTFTVEVTGLGRGQSIQLQLPRPWSRPWGLE